MWRKLLVKAVACSSLVGAVLIGAGVDSSTRAQTAGSAVQSKARSKATTTAPLDLNRATAEELQQTLPGVGEVTARKIVEGRPYTKVDDLARVGVPARTIDAIRPLVSVGAPEPAPAAKKKGAAKETTVAAPSAKVNLNTADSDQLESLPGIGPAIAKAIIAARPFSSVDDLERVKGMGKVKIDEVRGLVMVGPAATGTTAAPSTTPAPKSTTPKASGKAAAKKLAAGQKVNINTGSKEDLDALPGIGVVKSQAIIDARPFKKIEDIMKVKGIKEHEFSLIKDLITVE
jgi:competence protein ComEA